MLSRRDRVPSKRIGAVAVVVVGCLLAPAGASATFEGSNGLLAFQDFPNAGDRSLMTIAPDGSGLTTLAAHGQTPSWSPTGKSLVFVDANGKIRRINAAGQNEKVLGKGFEPQFSPDGKRIVFSAKSDKSDFDNAIFTMRSTNGKDKERVTDPGKKTSLSDEHPTFAPNGKKIAFHRELDPSFEDSDIFTVKPNGKSLKNLTKTPDTEDEGPDYSPDGKTIVFSTSVDADNDIDVDHLATMNSNGSGRQEIHAADDFGADPVFSPDGTKIAYQCSFAGKPTICVADANGQNEAGVPNIPSTGPTGGSSLSPSWQAK